MTNQEQDVDSDAGGEGRGGDLKSPKKPYSKIAVELTDEDLKSAGVQKLLLAEISRLEHYSYKYDSCNGELILAKQKCAVLEEKQKAHDFLDALYTVGIGIGATLIGLTPSVTGIDYLKLVVLGLGAALVLAAVAAKVRHK